MERLPLVGKGIERGYYRLSRFSSSGNALPCGQASNGTLFIGQTFPANGAKTSAKTALEAPFPPEYGRY